MHGTRPDVRRQSHADERLLVRPSPHVCEPHPPVTQDCYRRPGASYRDYRRLTSPEADGVGRRAYRPARYSSTQVRLLRHWPSSPRWARRRPRCAARRFSRSCCAGFIGIGAEQLWCGSAGPRALGSGSVDCVFDIGLRAPGLVVYRVRRYRNCYRSCGARVRAARVGLRRVRRRTRYPHLCRSRALRCASESGGWGIRTPEGVTPTRFPSGLEGSRAGVGGRVWAGQRRVRTEAVERGRVGLETNCYRNCYRSLWSA